MHLKARVDGGRNIPVHLVGIIPVNKGSQRVILLDGVSLAPKYHPAHLSAESNDHCVVLALAIEVRIPFIA